MNEKTLFEVPVGYYKFHKKQVFNFQLNRWYSLGFARYEDMVEAGRRIEDISDWKKVMVDLAQKAESEGRLLNAAIYYRGAEFYITQRDPDKFRYYDKFIGLFYLALEDEGIQRFKIPYEESFLPALKVPVKVGKKKGTIVMHGGFDSFIEEFYSMMRIFSENGYDVIGFEGPGQGGAIRRYDLAWDEKWERPTKAVLEYFDLDDVTLYGISMGGYLCLRASAFDCRIKRVVSSGGAVDYWKIMDPISRGILRFFLHFKGFTTRVLRKKMETDAHHNWYVENSMFITRIDHPTNAILRLLDMTEENMHPERIKQDVLLLTGRNDHFIPLKMHKKMIRALKNARSVTGMIYTKEQSADNHCQIGNIPLVCKDIIEWIEEKSV